jgi:hypothetical protein
MTGVPAPTAKSGISFKPFNDREHLVWTCALFGSAIYFFHSRILISNITASPNIANQGPLKSVFKIDEKSDRTQ